MYPLFFIIGASGAGKTSALKALEPGLSRRIRLFHFDDIGVPSFEEMYTQYNGPENWQKMKTGEWVSIIHKTFLAATPVILEGQTRPEFIVEACRQHGISNYKIILFDCADEERAKRLITRGQEDLADQNMMEWARYLREECKRQKHPIIDTTHLSKEAALQHLSDLLNNYTEHG